MTDRDSDLIIDLVENRLSQAEAEAALTRIKSDPELATEYEQQVAVRSALTAEAAVHMSSSERSSLRMSLAEQLNLEETPEVAPIRTAKRRAWWQPVLGLTAVAAAVTAIVVLPGTFGSSSDSGDETAFSAITVAESSPPSAELAPENGTDQGMADASGGIEEAVSVPQVNGVDIPELLTATAGDKTPEEVSEETELLGYRQSLTVYSDDIDRCLEQLSGKLPPETTGAIVLGAEPSDTAMIVHLGLTFADGIQAGVSIDLADCSVVTFDR